MEDLEEVAPAIYVCVRSVINFITPCKTGHRDCQNIKESHADELLTLPRALRKR